MSLAIFSVLFTEEGLAQKYYINLRQCDSLVCLEKVRICEYLSVAEWRRSLSYWVGTPRWPDSGLTVTNNDIKRCNNGAECRPVADVRNNEQSRIIEDEALAYIVSEVLLEM